MLSLSSKKTSAVIRQHYSLQKTIKTTLNLSLRQQPRAKLATTAAASTTKQQNQPVVISRRAWLDFKQSQGIARRRPDPSKRAKQDDEKPWPRNMQIAGYVAGVIAVPYLILWTITSNPTLREWCGPYIPLDKLRTHYGKLEWDARSYSEDMEETENRIKNGNNETQLSVGYYQFPEEAPFHERRQQEATEAMHESHVNVTLSLLSSSSSIPEETVTKKIPARTVAKTKDLLEYFPSIMSLTRGNSTVAVDFLDKNHENNDTDNLDSTRPLHLSDVPIDLSSDGTLTTDANSMKNIKIGTKNDGPHELSLGGRQLMTETQTLSKWAYIPQAAGESSNKRTNDSSGVVKASQLTQVDMEISRLKYNISELEKNLRDPMCTRSIDDMTTELGRAKRDLSRLTWKKRFGLV
mmetsp:Transcript_2836/g.7787  ORF Transcript_2836/g.7787 Transcript_2836/m.7787 type:complete len:408 (+) Transcript_2836:253-1476(+)